MRCTQRVASHDNSTSHRNSNRCYEPREVDRSFENEHFLTAPTHATDAKHTTSCSCPPWCAPAAPRSSPGYFSAAARISAPSASSAPGQGTARKATSRASHTRPHPASKNANRTMHGMKQQMGRRARAEERTYSEEAGVSAV